MIINNIKENLREKTEYCIVVIYILYVVLVLLSLGEAF